MMKEFLEQSLADSELGPETHHGSDVVHGFSRKSLVSEEYRTGTVFTQAL